MDGWMAPHVLTKKQNDYGIIKSRDILFARGGDTFVASFFWKMITKIK